MSTEKQVNYTAEQTAAMVAAYNAAPTRETVEQMAAKFGKTFRSVVAKLTREKVYIKPEYVSKSGEKPVKKDDTATAIANILGMNVNDADSLTKCNKSALQKIFSALANSRPIDGAEDAAPLNTAQADAE